MNPAEQKGRHPSAAEAKPVAKKPYVKPEVRHERIFETRALSCGKIGDTQRSCFFNRRSS